MVTIYHFFSFYSKKELSIRIVFRKRVSHEKTACTPIKNLKKINKYDYYKLVCLILKLTSIYIYT